MPNSKIIWSPELVFLLPLAVFHLSSWGHHFVASATTTKRRLNSIKNRKLSLFLRFNRIAVLFSAVWRVYSFSVYVRHTVGCCCWFFSALRCCRQTRCMRCYHILFSRLWTTISWFSFVVGRFFFYPFTFFSLFRFLSRRSAHLASKIS